MARGKRDKVITQANRPTVGSSVYGTVDNASGEAVRTGFLEARKGAPDNDAYLGRVSPRGRTMARESYGIPVRRGPWTEQYPGTLAAGRIVPPATSYGRAFSAARMFGPQG